MTMPCNLHTLSVTALMTEIDWAFAPLGFPAFLRDHWLKSFVHISGKRGRFNKLLTWNELNAILEQHRLGPRLKLYRDGQQIPPAQYLTPPQFGVPRLDSGGLAVSLARGASLIIDEVQELAPRVQDLLAGLQSALRTDAYANLYAGWHTQKAFNQHWDSQEVVVLQLYGRKRWKVWRPTRQHPLKSDAQTLAPLPAGAPDWDGMLENGDMLYLPRGWWHEVWPLDEPSLHLSVSLTPPNGLDYLGWLASRLGDHPELRASLAWNDETAHSALADTITRLLSEAMRETPPADYLREWEANIRPAPHIRLPEAAYDQFADVTEKTRIRLAALNLLSFSQQGEHAVFLAAGRLWTIPAVQQQALARLRNDRDIAVRELAKALADPAAKDALIASLGVLARAGVILVTDS
jgi:ribosomal protein L16 Arg81 hydroxylase